MPTSGVKPTRQEHLMGSTLRKRKGTRVSVILQTQEPRRSIPTLREKEEGYGICFGVQYLVTLGQVPSRRFSRVGVPASPAASALELRAFTRRADSSAGLCQGFLREGLPSREAPLCRSDRGGDGGVPKTGGPFLDKKKRKTERKWRRCFGRQREGTVIYRLKARVSRGGWSWLIVGISLLLRLRGLTHMYYDAAALQQREVNKPLDVSRQAKECGAGNTHQVVGPRRRQKNRHRWAWQFPHT